MVCAKNCWPCATTVVWRYCHGRRQLQMGRVSRSIQRRAETEKAELGLQSKRHCCPNLYCSYYWNWKQQIYVLCREDATTLHTNAWIHQEHSPHFWGGLYKSLKQANVSCRSLPTNCHPWLPCATVYSHKTPQPNYGRPNAWRSHSWRPRYQPPDHNSSSSSFPNHGPWQKIMQSPPKMRKMMARCVEKERIPKKMMQRKSRMLMQRKKARMP